MLRPAAVLRNRSERRRVVAVAHRDRGQARSGRCVGARDAASTLAWIRPLRPSWNRSMPSRGARGAARCGRALPHDAPARRGEPAAAAARYPVQGVSRPLRFRSGRVHGMELRVYECTAGMAPRQRARRARLRARRDDRCAADADHQRRGGACAKDAPKAGATFRIDNRPVMAGAVSSPGVPATAGATGTRKAKTTKASSSRPWRKPAPKGAKKTSRPRAAGSPRRARPPAEPVAPSEGGRDSGGPISRRVSWRRTAVR